MIKINIIFANLALALFCGCAYADIIFDGRFSKGDFSGYRALEANGALSIGASVPEGVSARLERVLDPAGSGRFVMRATNVIDDKPTHGGTRSELSTFRDPIGSERWYAWGYYLPDTWKIVKNQVAIAQIQSLADVGESDMRNPPLALLVANGKLKLVNSFDYDKITSPPDRKPVAGVDFERRELASWVLETNKWTYLVLHVKWAADDTGFFEFWKDGELLFKESDHINTFNDERGLWFKSGLYDWSPNPVSMSAYSTGIKIGDGKETFDSMSISIK
ncbi:MAG: polysaccharide lyase [Nitrosospira sp.]